MCAACNFIQFGRHLLLATCGVQAARTFPNLFHPSNLHNAWMIWCSTIWLRCRIVAWCMSICIRKNHGFSVWNVMPPNSGLGHMPIYIHAMFPSRQIMNTGLVQISTAKMRYWVNLSGPWHHDPTIPKTLLLQLLVVRQVITAATWTLRGCDWIWSSEIWSCPIKRCACENFSSCQVSFWNGTFSTMTPTLQHSPGYGIFIPMVPNGERDLPSMEQQPFWNSYRHYKNRRWSRMRQRVPTLQLDRGVAKVAIMDYWWRFAKKRKKLILQFLVLATPVYWSIMRRVYANMDAQKEQVERALFHRWNEITLTQPTLLLFEGTITNGKIWIQDVMQAIRHFHGRTPLFSIFVLKGLGKNSFLLWSPALSRLSSPSSISFLLAVSMDSEDTIIFFTRRGLVLKEA